MVQDDRPVDEPSGTVEVRAWRVHDTGLVSAPGPFRRLPGAVRHHRGTGAMWPDQVTLVLSEDALEVVDVGSWPLGEVRVRVVADGPPATFVLDVPGGPQLLAAPADSSTRALLAALS